MTNLVESASQELAQLAKSKKFQTILADPPWRFTNRTGKVAPEHRRLGRYGTMSLNDICALPIAEVSVEPAHLYLWVPNALLPEGLQVMAAWGFQYKSNIVWHKIRKDGGPDGRGVGFYFRNTTELILFGVRGKKARTLAPGRRQVNILKTRKREHSRKPDELYDIIEACSRGPFLELFARGQRPGWTSWGDQSGDYVPTWTTYANHSASDTAQDIRLTGNRVTADETQLAFVAPSLVQSEVTKKKSKRACLMPETFILDAFLNAPGQMVLAATAFEAYERACRQRNLGAVNALQFWKTMSLHARKKGITKIRVNAKVAYKGLGLREQLVAA